MKAFNGFKAEEKVKGYPQLPAGPYVAIIRAVKIEGEEPNQTLVLRLDIAEGPWTDYYKKRFIHDDQRKNAQFPAKYKGDLKLRVPSTESDYYEKNLSIFNDAMWKVEKSNPGYQWDWNENGLVGKYVGLSVQQGTYNGNKFTRPARLEIADKVRRGEIEVMPPMEPRSDAYEAPGAVYTPPVTQQVNYTEAMTNPGFTAVNVDDLPF